MRKKLPPDEKFCLTSEYFAPKVMPLLKFGNVEDYNIFSLSLVDFHDKFLLPSDYKFAIFTLKSLSTIQTKKGKKSDLRSVGGGGG
ncbi:MAG: hypothetical protein IJU48_04915, partial [Synergistaceae bacterium]|nr:hypothetical protein [Synergistaceae bacterium]